MRMTLRLKLAIGVLLSMTALLAAPAVTAQAAGPVVQSGMAIDVEETFITVGSCTLGGVLSQTRAITAGHCGQPGKAVYNSDGARIGSIGANRMDLGLDIAVVNLAPNVRVQVDSFDWSGSFYDGQVVSKAGITTGFTQGVVTNPVPTKRNIHGFSLAPPFLINAPTYSVDTNLHSKPGDSGSGIRDANGNIIGILSAGATDNDTLFAPISMLPAHLR